MVEQWLLSQQAGCRKHVMHYIHMVLQGQELVNLLKALTIFLITVMLIIMILYQRSHLHSSDIGIQHLHVISITTEILEKLPNGKELKTNGEADGAH